MSASVMHFLIATTIASSLAVLCVSVLRKPLRRLAGPQSAYWLWMLVPATALAIFVPAPHERILANTLPGSVGEVLFTSMVRVATTGASSDFLQLGLATWLLGVCLMAAASVLRQRAFVRSLGDLGNGPEGVPCSESIAGPMVLGAWRARVIVPADFASRYTPAERRLMLAHEQAHLARGDAFANAAAAAWLCLFWFNPLMYWAVGRLQFDQELACDARVVSRRAAARKLYASALLKAQMPAASAWRMPLGCHWQSSHPLKERIAALKNPSPGAARRLSGAALAVALSVSGILAVTFASGTALAPKTSGSSAPIAADWMDRPISIQLRDKDAREALRMIARESGHKIVVSAQAAEKLKEKLTMHFVDVKTSACLDLLMTSAGLVYRQSGGVIFVDVRR